MKRLLLAGLILFLLSLTLPGLRSRAVPKYRGALAWTWQYLEGPMTPVLTPWRIVETQSEMGKILTELVAQRNRGRPPPTTDDLPGFMLRARLDSTATDMWGKRYDIFFQADSLYLRSAGPDTIFGSEDDLVSPVRYPRPRGGPGRVRR